MKSKLKLGLGLSLAFLIFLGYSFKPGTSVEDQYQKIEKQTTKNDLSITGEELFLKNCSACHGSDRQGNPPTFPSLVYIDQKLTKVEIGTLLTTGRNVMPDFSHLSDAERTAIIGFLYGEETMSEHITEITAVENGKNIFVANCTRCHQAKADDATANDQKPWGMQPPVLGGISNRFNTTQFKNILNMGPCYMPSFMALADSDKEDIYAYLSTIEGNQKSNYRIRKMSCRMSMR